MSSEPQTPVDLDAGRHLEEICLAAVRDLALTGAVVTLISAAGAQAIAAASGEAIRRVEELQFDLGEGPSMAAFTAGQPVLIEDLASPDVAWLAYAAAATGAGTGSVFAFPVHVGEARLGVLTMYSDRSRVPNPAELNACHVFTGRVVEALLAGSHSLQELPVVPASLRFRTEVYQAQGMVMVDLGVGLDDALARMRAHAYAADTDLTDVARGILAGRIRFKRGEGI